MAAETSAASGEFARAWRVILAGAVGVGLGVTGLPIYTTGLFVRPLQEAFGWSRAQSTGGLLCLTIGSVVMAPLIGRLIERWGVRRVAMLAQLGLCLGYFGLTLNGGQLSGWYVGWAVLAVLGAGTSPIVWTSAVASWFGRSRGLALGITLCGTGAVAVIGPAVIGGIIGAYGWRAGFYTLSAAQLVAGLPLTVLLLRARPGSAGSSIAADGISLRDAVRRSRFWRLLLAFFMISIVVGGLIVHLAPLLADRGIAQADAARALGLLGFAIIAGRLSVGFLVDRFPATRVAPVVIALPIVSCVLLARGQSPIPAIILAGLSAGAEVDLLAYLVSWFYGLRHYPRIYAWGLSAFSAGAGTGPLLAGWAHDAYGSYAVALWMFAVLLAASAVLLGTLGRPQPSGE